MPTPLPDALSAVLRTDSTAALAALIVIANAHKDLFAWAVRMIWAEPVEPKPNGIGPGASIGDWMSAIGKSRSSTLSALKRLRDAGLAESVEGRWRLVEEPAPRAKANWVAPLRGTDRAATAHLTAAS